MAAFYPVAIAIASFASMSAAAKDYRARDVGEWTVAASEDGEGCFLSRQYTGAGATTLLFGLDTDTKNHLSVLNDNWSIAPQQRLKLDFRLSKGGYTQQLAIGLISNGKKGFVTTFEVKFPDYFATSPALYISKGNVPVAQLSLAGSGPAIAELRRCVEARQVARGSDAPDRQRPDRIPKDPFAPGLTKRAKR